jgi:hypothetical protein
MFASVYSGKDNSKRLDDIFKSNLLNLIIFLSAASSSVIINAILSDRSGYIP